MTPTIETVLTRSPVEAAAFLRAGGLVAFPTETVYGLGADAQDEAAVRLIFAAKGRPADNPVIVHLAHRDQLAEVALPPPDFARALLDRFVPGPTTLILPRRPAVPDVVTGGLDTVGVRIPRHAVAQAFLRACGRPVAAPSANRSGRPSPTTWEAVYEDLAGRIACLLQGERSASGLESTVVDCTGRAPVVLRAGVVSLEELRDVVPTTRMAEDSAAHRVRSPGTRYRHYAPRARVIVVAHPDAVRPGDRAAYIGLAAPSHASAWSLVEVVPSAEAYAYALYDFFRRCDAAGLAVIHAQSVAPIGIGLALMDRLRRAAAAGEEPAG